MQQNKSPIAVFDSGLGGISVLKELIRLMPRENYIYYGDSQNAPYGPKTAQEVHNLTLANINFLIEKCPECGSRSIGEGVFSGYANLSVKGKPFSASKVIAQVCSNCGLIIQMRVNKPEKFTPKDI